MNIYPALTPDIDMKLNKLKLIYITLRWS